MSNYIVSDTSLGSVADAIRTKGGTSAPLTYPQGFIDAIDAISGGGDEPIPEDGKTRIWIHIAEGTPDNRLTFYLRFTASVANNTTVDWGDGVSETLGSTTATNYPHKYPSGGDYIITMTVNSGTIAFEGDSNNRIYGSGASANSYNRARIIRIIFGGNVTSIGDYACNNCYGLKSVTIPDSVTSIGSGTYGVVFSSCYNLQSITIPNNVTSIRSSVFNSCYNLQSVIIPDSVTSIEQRAFYLCYSLTKIIIPDSVTSIGANAFYNCYGMSEYHFKPTTPPALASINAFGSISSDCIIYVPQGSLNAYKTATNWSTIASQMQEEPT